MRKWQSLSDRQEEEEIKKSKEQEVAGGWVSRAQVAHKVKRRGGIGHGPIAAHEQRGIGTYLLPENESTTFPYPKWILSSKKQTWFQSWAFLDEQKLMKNCRSKTLTFFLF